VADLYGAVCVVVLQCITGLFSQLSTVISGSFACWCSVLKCVADLFFPFEACLFVCLYASVSRFMFQVTTRSYVQL